MRLEVHGENAPVWAEVKFEKNIKVAVIADLHIPFHDQNALQLAKNILKDVKPDITVLNGDVIDFFAISRFSKDPRRKLELGKEIREARSLLNKLFAEIQTRWIYIEGNHENRLRLFIWNRASELVGLEELELENLLRLKEHNVLYLRHPDTVQSIDQFATPQVKVGMLYIAHGDTFRLSWNTVGIARCLFLKTLKNLLIGHWHRADEWKQADYEGRLHGCWVVPCLSLQRPNWDTGRIWGQGMALIEVTPRGFFRVDLISFIQENGNLLAFANGKEFRVAKR